MEIGPVPIMISWLIPVPFLVTALWRPKAGQMILGLLYIAMGLGVNLPLVFLNPTLFVEIGQSALLAFYQPLFLHVVALAPAVFGLIVALYEITIGVLMLQGGRNARLGLLGAALFNLFIVPLNAMTVPNVLLVATELYLLARTPSTVRKTRKAA